MAQQTNSMPWWLPCSRPSQRKDTQETSWQRQQELLRMPLPRMQTATSSTSGTSGTTFDTGSKVLKGPDVFSPGTLDEQVLSWSEWSFIFKNYIGFMDPNYLSEFSWAENHSGLIAEDEYTAGSEKGRRAVKLYSVLSSYLKN